MRILAFIILLIAALTTPLPFFLFCAFLYIFLWTGFEVLIIAVFVDSIFGMTTTSFFYAISVGALLASAEMLRPYLSWYSTRS
jgi:predicted membrane protein